MPPTSQIERCSPQVQQAMTHCSDSARMLWATLCGVTDKIKERMSPMEVFAI